MAVHVVANQSFTDEKLGKVRKSGEEYLITAAESETFIPDVYEKVLGQVILFSDWLTQYNTDL